MDKSKNFDGDTIRIVNPKVFEDLKTLTNDELDELVRDSIFCDILTDLKASALGIELRRRKLPTPSLDLVHKVFAMVTYHVAKDEDLFDLKGKDKQA